MCSASPLREFHFRHPRRSVSLSMRKSSVMKEGGIFSADFLKVLIPSLLVSHILALGLGYAPPARVNVGVATHPSLLLQALALLGFPQCPGLVFQGLHWEEDRGSSRQLLLR